MCGTRRFSLNLRRPRGQQPVARHREEDPRLAVLKHQQHRRDRDDGAKRHDPSRGLEPRDIQRLRQRIGGAQLHVRARGPVATIADDHVDQRADRQAAENADRQVALRILRLFRRRRDGVEADVGEEDDGRALVDAGPAIRRERARSWPVSMCIAPTTTNRPSTSSLTTTMMLLARALSLTPSSSTHVTSITIAKAGILRRIGMPPSPRRGLEQRAHARIARST